MIFAELEYPQDYWDFHDELVCLVRANFLQVDSGHQSDSWIWITRGEEKVAIDTFTAMKHQVKSARPGPLVQEVLDVLAAEYKLRVYASPEPEGHE